MKFKIMGHGKSYNIATIEQLNQYHTDIQADNEERKIFWGYRHTVVLIGFFGNLLLNAHRLVMSVAIVAMVNHTNSDIYSNTSLTSCKINPDSLEENGEVKQNIPGEFDWSSQLQGYILGAGFIGYFIALPPAGRVTQIWNTKRTFIFGNTLCAFFTFISPFASWYHPYALIFTQLCRGIGQGIQMPPVYGMLANWIPQHERALLSTMTMCGFSIGILVGGMVSGWLCDLPELGWPYAFYIFGIFSVMISLFCALFFYELPENHPSITKFELKLIRGNEEMDFSKKKPALPWKRIFTSVPIYALIIALYGHFWSIAYFVSVHPLYMGTILHFPIAQNGVLSTIPVICKALGGIFASALSTWLHQKNYVSVNNLRKGCNSIGSVGYSACILGVYFAGCNATMNIVFFTIALFFGGLALSGPMITCLDMSPTFAASLSGFISAGASLANISIPIMVGIITKNQTIEEWHEVFFITIGVVFTTGVIFQFFGSADVQPWNYVTNEDKENKQSEESSSKH